MRAWLPNWDLATIPAKIFKKEMVRREISYFPGMDLSTIPEGVFNSERQRRNNAKRTSFGGGVVWTKHIDNYSRCRCPDCNLKREQREAEPKPPKRPRGRPRTRPVAEGPKRPQGRPRKVAIVEEVGGVTA